MGIHDDESAGKERTDSGMSNDAPELSDNVKNKLADAVEAWADEHLDGHPAIVANMVYMSLETELLRKQKEFEEVFND